jgi:hypothetical protein
MQTMHREYFMINPRNNLSKAVIEHMPALSKLRAPLGHEKVCKTSRTIFEALRRLGHPLGESVHLQSPVQHRCISIPWRPRRRIAIRHPFEQLQVDKLRRHKNRSRPFVVEVATDPLDVLRSADWKVTAIEPQAR